MALAMKQSNQLASAREGKVTLTTWGQDRSFKQMLELLRTVDVQIAGPGSSHMNELFLGDGAVSIGYGVLGGPWSGPSCFKSGPEGGCLAVFLDDYFISGISYLKGLWKARYDLPNAGAQGYRISREKNSRAKV